MLVTAQVPKCIENMNSRGKSRCNDLRVSYAGYTDGSGVLRGMGKGLVGAIGLPVSGALGLVSSVSAGVASATGAK